VAQAGTFQALQTAQAGIQALLGASQTATARIHVTRATQTATARVVLPTNVGRFGPTFQEAPLGLSSIDDGFSRTAPDAGDLGLLIVDKQFDRAHGHPS
jgi:hypothetical protein